MVCFETGDGESHVDKESNKNIEALMATFLRIHIVANRYLLKSEEPHCCQLVFTQIHVFQSTIITVVLAVYFVISQTIRISNWVDRGALHVLILRLVLNPWMYAS